MLGAPWSLSSSQSRSLRHAAKTRQPRALSVNAASRPQPDEQPVINIERRSAIGARSWQQLVGVIPERDTLVVNRGT